VPLPLITERLELRAYRIEDVPRIHELLYGNEEARRLTGGVWTIGETQATVERHMRRQELDGFSFWLVVERATGEIVGEAGLKPFDDKGPEIELGYAFTPTAWGKGYATEAGRAALDEGFGTIGLEQIVAVTDEVNTRSQRVIEKLGFTPAGHRAAYGCDLLFYVLDGT